MAFKETNNMDSILEGAEELLVAWANSINDLSFGSNEGNKIELDLSIKAAIYWFKISVGQLPKVESPYTAATTFRNIADERRIIVKENFQLKERENIITGTFLSHDCPYKKCCADRKRKSKPYLCFRAVPFTTAIKLMTDNDYKREVVYEKTEPGEVCVIRAVPMQTTYKVGLSYKLKPGNVKINDIDLAKIGIDLIDSVEVSAAKDHGAGRKIIAMSFSQSKYPSGMILMNVNDAKRIGLMEKDNVLVKKSSKQPNYDEAYDFEYDSSKYEANHSAENDEEIESMQEVKEVQAEKKIVEAKQPSVPVQIPVNPLHSQKEINQKPLAVQSSVLKKKPVSAVVNESFKTKSVEDVKLLGKPVEKKKKKKSKHSSKKSKVDEGKQLQEKIEKLRV